MVQHLNNNLTPHYRIDYDLDALPDFGWSTIVEPVFKLYGVRYIGQYKNVYQYEAIVLDDYTPKASDIIYVYNVITLDTTLEESQIKQISDTCLHFVLSQYYDPSIYQFSIDSLWH